MTGSWPEMRQQFGERLIDEVTKYAPNFRDAIIDWTLLTPEDIEDRIGLTDGNIRHLDIIPQQILSRRPLPGWSDYRTPVEGLYLCGAGTHPGGEVTGAPGQQRRARRAGGARPLSGTSPYTGETRSHSEADGPLEFLVAHLYFDAVHAACETRRLLLNSWSRSPRRCKPCLMSSSSRTKAKKWADMANGA